MFKKGQVSQTFLVYDNNTGKTSRLVRLISVASVDILSFLGHRDLDLPYSVCEEVYLLVFWSILLKIERDLYLLKVDRVFFGNDNMSKIYERLMFTIIPQGKKKWDSFDP